ncbi:hypothetical protein SEA_RASPUTIA_127 [Microbacterium phage Rasputia]|nr:hypothetical protein SEA_RASPUTIA_127 [Microbacterium phage Rasputia]
MMTDDKNETRTYAEHVERLEAIVSSIRLGMKCEVRLGFSSDRDEHFVQIACMRMDVITKIEDWGYGGKAWPSRHASDSEVIQQIFGLYKSYWEHEARETFELCDELGEYRRPFGPHIDTWALWSVARRVDVRSQQHTDDRPVDRSGEREFCGWTAPHSSHRPVDSFHPLCPGVIGGED